MRALCLTLQLHSACAAVRPLSRPPTVSLHPAVSGLCPDGLVLAAACRLPQCHRTQYLKCPVSYSLPPLPSIAQLQYVFALLVSTFRRQYLSSSVSFVDGFKASAAFFQPFQLCFCGFLSAVPSPANEGRGVCLRRCDVAHPVHPTPCHWCLSVLRGRANERRNNQRGD
jgi:hypothetical protein